MSDRLLAALRTIVGPDHVLGPDDPGLHNYSDPFSFLDSPTLPAGVVLPSRVEEVQAIVRAANEHAVPLWTVSRGRNLGYGGASPTEERCVVLDLQRLNRIRTVDTDSAYAVVEPGVSFFDLYEHLQSEQIPLWASVPDLGGGSLLGNALERGFGYTAHGQHAEFVCGLEVVLPNGELLHTGMGAMEGSRERHIYRAGFGPSVDGLFSQSNLGIVTAMGVWLMPRPEQATVCMVKVPDQQSLAPLVDVLRPLMLDRTIDGVAILGNALAVASGLMPRSAISTEPGLLAPQVVAGLAERLGIGYWNGKFGLYGPAAVVDAKLEVVRRAIAQVSGAQVGHHTYPGTVTRDQVQPGDLAQLGIPSSEAIQMAGWRGGDPAHVDFSVVTSTVGSQAQRLVDLVQSILESYELDHVGGFTMFGRHAIMLNLVSFDRSSPEDRALVRSVFTELLARAAAEGFAPYRAHVGLMDATADVYGADDGALRRLVRAVKDTLDPGGVLSPGKQGIWPSGSRVAR
jgi:4-cresol dehydrogenase (hydroxylating)